MNNNLIGKILKKNNINVTENRVKVFKCLIHEPHLHSISDILNHDPSLSMKSVYNTIKVFVRNGIIDSISTGGVSNYSISDNLELNDLDGKVSIHVLTKKGQIKHLSISKNVFKKIDSEVKNQLNKKVNSIKITITLK